MEKSKTTASKKKTAEPLSSTTKDKEPTKSSTISSKPVVASKPTAKTSVVSKDIVSEPTPKETVEPLVVKTEKPEETKIEEVKTSEIVKELPSKLPVKGMSKMPPKKMPVKKIAEKTPAVKIENKAPVKIYENKYGLPIPEEKMAEIEKNLSADLCEENDTFNLDVCFMLDCTGSMGSYIQMAKEKIGEIMEQLKSQYSDSVVRIGIIAYRDVDDKDRFDILDFNESADVAKSFLGKQNATGGGDTPEDVNGAMQLALYHMKWKYPTRMLYHIADAPCHGKTYHTADDSHPNGFIQDAKWERLLTGIKNLDISYLYFDIDSLTEKMYNIFKTLYEKTEAKDNLIFSYEVLKPIVPEGGGVRRMRGAARMLRMEGDGVGSSGADGMDMAGGGGGEDISKVETHKKFVAKTIETATKSRAMNIEKMSKKKASKPM